MSIRQRGETWIVEIYDPITKRKTHVRPRDHGLDPPRNERQAKALERAALNARDHARPGTGDETCDSFTARWADDFTEGRGESTRLHHRERVSGFGKQFEGRTLRSITPGEARTYATDHRSAVPALRAMFNDALDDGLVDGNPFAKLGFAGSKGREDITVLTLDEITRLAAIARDVHSGEFGDTIAALITWSAYTCVRPGEAFAATFDQLDGDVYHLHTQFNSKLRKETPPKHNSVGTIYVPEPARKAVLALPRRLGDPLMFRSKRGKQLRQESLHRAWTPIRSAFMATLDSGHHLRQRLAVDPDDRLDYYELRHFGASHMLNDLGIEPWVIAKQLRHKDDRLILLLYGHPTTDTALERMRRAFTGAQIRGINDTTERRDQGAFGG